MYNGEKIDKLNLVLTPTNIGGIAMKKTVNYNLGLDIGTSSIGYAATDDQGRPVRHGNKTVIF